MINTNKDNVENLSSVSANARDGITYLLIGGGIGAVLALLFAPKSGREIRSEIAEVSRRGYDLTREKANELKEQSADTIQVVKDKASSLYDLAASKLNLGAEEIIKDVAKTAALKPSNSGTDSANIRTRNSSLGRKPASIF